MAIVSLVSIVFTMEIKNFAISFYKLREGVVYNLVLVKNAYYKYKNAAKIEVYFSQIFHNTAQKFWFFPNISLSLPEKL